MQKNSGEAVVRCNKKGKTINKIRKYA